MDSIFLFPWRLCELPLFSLPLSYPIALSLGPLSHGLSSTSYSQIFLLSLCPRIWSSLTSICPWIRKYFPPTGSDISPPFRFCFRKGFNPLGSTLRIYCTVVKALLFVRFSWFSIKKLLRKLILAAVVFCFGHSLPYFGITEFTDWCRKSTPTVICHIVFPIFAPVWRNYS